MNKFAKGSLAAGAGIVLLLGGAGTLAFWNSTADLTGGTINNGTLALTATAGTWTEGGEKLTDVEKFTMVPGDELTYTVNLDLNAQGDNIAGEIALDQSFVKISEGAADQIEVNLDLVESETPLKGITAKDDILTFAGAYKGSVPVEVTVSFPYDAAKQQNSSQGAVVDLETISFVATQTPATAPAE